MACIIHNVHGSNFGNLMIKYLSAREISKCDCDVILSNYEMPYWGISHPAIENRGENIMHFRHDQIINIRHAQNIVSSQLFSSIELHGHLQRMENLPTAEEARGVFEDKFSIGCSFGDNFIVCPIRGAETLSAIHSGYTLIPIQFYDEIFKETDLKPVFCGQTEPNIYTNELRQKFRDAIFLPPQGAAADFCTIRHSTHIIVPISTFAWIAAWLSKATSIFLPVFGLFNPQQFPDHDLLPVGDARYKFYQFPIHEAVPVEKFTESHAKITGSWSRVNARALARS